MTWKAKTPNNLDDAFYSVLESTGDAMSALRSLFPTPRKDINELSFVLFSTSGVHGSYTTIEDVEEWLKLEGGAGKPWDPREPDSTCPGVTFLVVHPRRVSLRYGVAYPKDQFDIDFLKLLRLLSGKVLRREARS